MLKKITQNRVIFLIKIMFSIEIDIFYSFYSLFTLIIPTIAPIKIEDAKSSKVKRLKLNEFAKTETERQALVFKVHGDIDAPEHIVLTQDDYDSYESTHPNFYTALENELALNNMLFIGYGFNDPDIKNRLKKLKAKNSSIGPNHFFIVKRATKRAARKEQLLFLQDIEKYGILSLIIDEYNEI
jgi:hypothetical protein